MSERTVVSASRILTFGPAGILTPGYVAIRKGRIESVGRLDDLEEHSNDQVLDFADNTIIPGLIDSHCHLVYELAAEVTEEFVTASTLIGVKAARSAIQAGVTTIRDLGCKHLGIFSLKQAIEDGNLTGPRILAAGPNLSGTGVPESWRNLAFDGTNEIRKHVRKLWKAGAEWAKLVVSIPGRISRDWWHDIPLMTLDEMKAATGEARAKGMRVACHVEGPVGAALAARAGSQSIEHGVHLTDDTIEKMVADHISYVPTIWLYSQDLHKKIPSSAELHRATFERALSAGVKIIAGTDLFYDKWSPNQPLPIASELAELVGWGMQEIDALGAATTSAAEMLGVSDQVGSLEPGKLADMVVISGDPVAEVGAIARVQSVIQEGSVVFDSRLGSHILEPVSLTALRPVPMH